MRVGRGCYSKGRPVLSLDISRVYPQRCMSYRRGVCLIYFTFDESRGRLLLLYAFIYLEKLERSEDRLLDQQLIQFLRRFSISIDFHQNFIIKNTSEFTFQKIGRDEITSFTSFARNS